MDPKLAARLLHGGRVVLGAALLVAPGTAARGWVGDLVERAGVRALVRSVGVRDMVLGMIALHTLDHPDVGPRWQATVGAVDAVDAIAVGLAAGELPASSVAGTAALASGAAAAGFWVSRALRA